MDEQQEESPATDVAKPKLSGAQKRKDLRKPGTWKPHARVERGRPR